MGRKERIGDICSLVGIVLGTIAGIAAHESADFMNPQGEFTHHPERIMLIFVLWFSCVSLPFFIVRHLIFLKDKILLCVLSLSIELSIIIGIFFGQGNYTGVFFASLIVSYCIFHFLVLLERWSKKLFYAGFFSSGK